MTFRKAVLQHLGIKSGDKIELDLLPDGRGMIKAARPAGTIASFVGLLAGKTHKVATIEEINEAAAQGWAGTRCRSLSIATSLCVPLSVTIPHKRTLPSQS